MPKTWSVYIHENKANGKVYIGITSQRVQSRWRDGKGYIMGYSVKTPFAHAIEKYGWSGFRHIVVLSGISEERANYVEKKLIRFFDATNREKGYNLSEGGGCSAGMKRSQEFCKHQSELKKGTVFSAETRKKMSEAKKGVVPWNKGKHPGCTEKQRAAAKMRSRRVKTSDGIFDSVTACAEYYGVPRKTLQDWLSGKRKPIRRYAHICASYID